ncbi:hypothetical protein C8R45DRAFT_394571 [Mycena sanguinolenta]|nr:hypothetical protein C8R45DRAFT_394571 [Mycena sanguinolenta]
MPPQPRLGASSSSCWRLERANGEPPTRVRYDPYDVPRRFVFRRRLSKPASFLMSLEAVIIQTCMIIASRCSVFDLPVCGRLFVVRALDCRRGWMADRLSTPLYTSNRRSLDRVISTSLQSVIGARVSLSVDLFGGFWRILLFFFRLVGRLFSPFSGLRRPFSFLPSSICGPGVACPFRRLRASPTIGVFPSRHAEYSLSDIMCALGYSDPPVFLCTHIRNQRPAASEASALLLFTAFGRWRCPMLWRCRRCALAGVLVRAGKRWTCLPGHFHLRATPAIVPRRAYRS